MSGDLMQQDVLPSSTGQRTIFTPYPTSQPEEGNAGLVVQVGESFYPIHEEIRPITYKQFARSRARIYYVNGMNTNPSGHLKAARHLAAVANQDVVGVFCPTMAKGLGDAVQVLFDYTLPVGRGMSAPREFFTSIMSKGASFLSNHPKAEQALILYGKSLLWCNPASRALFETLWHAAKSSQKSIVVCHSQGNLITANACWVLQKLRAEEPRPMGNVIVMGLASPNPSWPDEHLGDFKLMLFRDKEDPITALSLPSIGRKPTLTPNSQGRTGLGAHGVHLYLSHPHFQKALHQLLRSSG